MGDRNNNNKKEITLNDLTQMMDEKFKKADELLDKKMERQAILIQDEFDEMNNKIKSIKSDTEDIKANLNKKVDQFEHNELVYRVERLEKKCA